MTTWGQLGLTGDWANRPIGLYGRNSASGTYGFFKEHVLMNGDYKDTVKEQPGSGVGRAGRHRRSVRHRLQRQRLPHVGRPRRAAGREGRRARISKGTYEEVTTGKYPLSRFLYIYVNKNPSKPLDPLQLEFLKLILSKEGQEVVVKDGYMPLTAAQVKEELAKIGK